MTGGRYTPLKSWALSIDYYDGRCEAVLGAGRRTRTYRWGTRCMRPASAAQAAHAVCAQHARCEPMGYWPAAAAFRFSSTEARAPQPADWDF